MTRINNLFCYTKFNDSNVNISNKLTRLAGTFMPTELPRDTFVSSRSSEAFVMNKFAIESLVNRTYNFYKSDSDEYKRLVDTSLSASYSRVVWRNPEDGKLYHILKDKKLDSGEFAVRILDENGGYIKEALIQPLKILIYELKSNDPVFIKKFDNGEVQNLYHSDILKIFAERNNPFAEVNVVFADKDFKNLVDSIDAKTPIISCSFCNLFSSVPVKKVKTIFERLFRKQKEQTNQSCANIAQGNVELPEFAAFRHVPNNVRIFMSAGNSGKNYNNAYFVMPNIEGVGSLSLDAKVADFSSSRNVLLTPHYELGEFPIFKISENGYNITGLHGTDIEVQHGELIPNFISSDSEHKVLEGSSFSVVIRAAKSLLNNMMRGVL